MSVIPEAGFSGAMTTPWTLGKGIPSCKPEERLVLSNEELNGIEMPKDFLSFFLAPSWLGLL